MKPAIVLCMVLLLACCTASRKGSQKTVLQQHYILPFDAAIVPGIPFKGKSWDSVMKARVLWSYILYKNGYVRHVIYSGGAVYTPYVEARVMGLYGQALGIPAKNIFYDTLAQHSTENVYYSYLLAKAQGFKTLMLATDPFQSILLKRFTRRRFATQILHVPFIIDSLSLYNQLSPVIDARTLRIKDWTGIAERESRWRRIRGTLGKAIPWKEYSKRKVPEL